MPNVHTRSKSGFITRNGVRRRETAWIGGTDTSDAIVGGSTAILLTSLNAAALALRPFTVVRSRGYIHLISDQTAASESQSIAYGHCVVSDQANAIGATAIPTPVTDSGSDLFFVYERLRTFFTFGSAIGFQSPAGLFKEYDSKAMRKIAVGEDLVVVVESSASTSGLSFQSFSRHLVKLH